MSNVEELKAALDSEQARIDALAAPIADWNAEALSLRAEVATLESDRLDQVAAGKDAAAKKLASGIAEKRLRLADLELLIPRREREVIQAVRALWAGPRQRWLDAVAEQDRADALLLGNRAGELQQKASDATGAALVSQNKAQQSSIAAGQNAWGNVAAAGISNELIRLLGHDPDAPAAAPAEDLAASNARFAAAVEAGQARVDAGGAAMREQVSVGIGEPLEPDEEPGLWTEAGFGAG